MRLHCAVLAALLPVAACTTLQPLADAQPATIRQAVEPGDRVELEFADGSRQALTVDSISETELVGHAGSKRHTVPLASIRSIGVRGMTTQDKVWTGVGIAAAVGVIAVLVSDGGGGGGGGGGGY